MKKSKLTTLLLCTSMLATSTLLGYTDSSTYLMEDKLIGANRYETAVKVSQKGWQNSSEAIIVNSGSIVDALAVTPYAKLKNAPILLTGKDSLDITTKHELIDLGVKQVHIIGGVSVVSEKVKQEIQGMGILTERIGGIDRHDTALKIATEIDKTQNVTKVAVVNGYKGLADAVSIAAVAAREGMAIIPASPNSGISAFDNFMKENNIEKSYIIGSTSAVSTQIEKTLPNPERIGGIDRNETNAKVINKFYTSNTLKNAYVAKDGMKKDDQLIDALAVGVLAAKQESPVVIVGNTLSPTQKEIFKNKKVSTITQVGSGGNENAFGELKEIQSNNNDDNNGGTTQNIRYVANTTSVNVRDTASITGNKIGSLLEGQAVEVISIDSSGWVKIKFENGFGYVIGSYLSTKSPDNTTETIKTKYVTVQNLNVRKGPSTEDMAIGNLTYGQKVEEVEMYPTGWVKIKYNSGYGFVSNDYLSVNPVK